jgi:hypothetical protein
MRSVADAEACLAAFGARRVKSVEDLEPVQEDLRRDELDKPSICGNSMIVIGQYQPMICEDDRGAPEAPGYVARVSRPHMRPNDPVAAVGVEDPAGSDAGQSRYRPFAERCSRAKRVRRCS